MSACPNEDLFTPTLTEQDDAAGFDRPWRPWSLVVLAFFFGLPAGGTLLALNFRRLGMPRRVVPALVLVALATPAMAAVSAWVAAARLAPVDSDADRHLRWILRAVSCLVAIGIALPQQRRFRLFQTADLPGGRLLWPGLAAVLVSLALQFLLFALFYLVFRLR
jgi:hypothetical protein